MRYAAVGALASGPLWIFLGWLLGTGWLSAHWPRTVMMLLLIGMVSVLLVDVWQAYSWRRKGKHCRGVRVCDLVEELRSAGPSPS